jgi:hypothetical protein
VRELLGRREQCAAPDRLLVGLATLTLVTQAAERQPLACGQLLAERPVSLIG